MDKGQLLAALLHAIGVEDAQQVSLDAKAAESCSGSVVYSLRMRHILTVGSACWISAGFVVRELPASC